MKLLQLFILMCFSFVMIASDQEQEEKKKLKALKVTMLLNAIKHCDEELANLSRVATDVEYTQAYARGFYRSIPNQMPEDMRRKMKFQFILLHNVHPEDASSAKSQCGWGLMGARTGAATFTETTAKGLVDTMISDHNERLQKAISDKANRQLYEQGLLSNFLGLKYEDFIQKIEREADHLNLDALDYHDIAKEFGYKHDQ